MDEREIPPFLRYVNTGRDLRDKGMEQALDAEHQRDPEWQSKCIALAALVPQGWVCLFEDIRLFLKARGMREPHVPQCWSALSGTLIRLNMFEHAEDWAQPESEASHASTYRKMRRL